MPEEFELPEAPDTPESHKERTVGLIIATIAVVLAFVTHKGNDIHQDEVLAHIDASDQYNFYQAKKDRRTLLELQLNDLQLRADTFSPTALAAATKLRDTYTSDSARLDDEAKEIKEKADELKVEAATLARKSSVLDIGEIALQISVVLCSLTILTEQSLFVRMGMGLALAGAAVAAWALLVPY